MSATLHNVEWSKYSNEAIEFTFSESAKLLEETFTSFRQNIDKSYLATAIYTGLLSFSYTQMLPFKSVYSVSFFILAIGAAYSIYCIWGNLKPNKMCFVGTQPKDLIHPYFESQAGKEQQYEMMRLKIEDHQTAINENIVQLDVRAKRFTKAQRALFISIVLSLIVTGLLV